MLVDALGLQLFLVAVAIACIAGMLLAGGRDARSKSLWIGVLVLVGATAAATLLSYSRATERLASRAQLVAEIPARLVASPDRAAAEYVTSDRCQGCHPGNHASWYASYHRTMTQKASPEAVLGPFAGQTLEARGRRYRLERRGEEFWVEMADPDWERDQLDAGRRPEDVADPPRLWKRIVMTTGSHHMQTYWVASERDGRLFNFPWLWLIEDQRWIPREDGFIRRPDGPRTFDVWHGACVECHAVAGEKNRGPRGQWNPEAAELGIACESCHGPAEEHVRVNQDPTRRYRLRLTDVPDPTIVNPARLDAEASSQVCGHCHGINLFKAYVRRTGKRYQPGEDLRATRILMRTSEKAQAEANHPDPQRALDYKHMQTILARQLAGNPAFLRDRFWPDGMVRVSGRELNSFIESACFEGGELSCLSCHSMHDSDPDGQLATFPSPSSTPHAAQSSSDHPSASIEADAACLQCHASYAENLESHTHHLAESSGSRCYNCHMPHTVYGLLKSIRSHWIDSPNAKTTVQTGRPDACSLCHLDRSLEWTAEHLEAWYGQPPPPVLDVDERRVASGVRWLLTGDAQQRALAAWHMGWPDAAGAALEPDWQVFFLGHLLDDPYPAVRYIAARALQNTDARQPAAYDFLASEEDRRDARAHVMAGWAPRPGVSRPDAGLLRGASGGLDQAAFERLAAMRNDQVMDLRE